MSGEQLIEAYLKRLAEAAEPLPAERREDLVAEVTAHIAEARAAGATSESDVRQMLQRLGDPADIVAEATDGLVLVEQPPKLRLREFAALLLLLIGPVSLMIGWLVGVWLLWASDRWNRIEKIVGTLAWPAGYVAAMIGDYVLFLPLWASLVLATLVPIAILAVLAKNAHPGRSQHSTLPAAASAN